MRSRNNHQLETLHRMFFLGFDEEDENEQEGEENSEEETDEEEENEDSSGNIDGLKSALTKERKARRRLERENKRLLKTSEAEAEKEKDDVTKAQEAVAKATSTVSSLTQKLLEQSLENHIIKAASKFADPDDALKLVDRDLIDFDQDEDDPTSITVDQDSVKSALESLLKQKPHLAKPEKGEDEGLPPSGSKFRGGKKGKEADEAALAQKYPALRRGSK